MTTLNAPQTMHTKNVDDISKKTTKDMKTPLHEDCFEYSYTESTLFSCYTKISPNQLYKSKSRKTRLKSTCLVPSPSPSSVLVKSWWEVHEVSSPRFKQTLYAASILKIRALWVKGLNHQLLIYIRHWKCELIRFCHKGYLISLSFWRRKESGLDNLQYLKINLCESHTVIKHNISMFVQAYSQDNTNYVVYYWATFAYSEYVLLQSICK